MRTRIRLAFLALCFSACIGSAFRIWIEPQPEPPPEPPSPSPFEGEEAPKLVPTGFPGLVAAPSVDPTLYYSEPLERWFRYAFNRWHEGFRWNGYWFPPERVPEPLKNGPLSGP